MRDIKYAQQALTQDENRKLLYQFQAKQIQLNLS
jgi:hypothetical protein